MGAILGILLVFWHLRTVQYRYQFIDISRIHPGSEFFSFLATSSLVTLGFTLIILLLIHVTAYLARRYYSRYTAGFYALFVLSCILVAVIGWLRWWGIIDILGY